MKGTEKKMRERERWGEREGERERGELDGHEFEFRVFSSHRLVT